MKISNATVTSKQNFIEKYHRLMKNLYFIFRLLFFTSNECFSHFNVQQLLSNLSHFVLFSQAHLKITLKTKTFEKICFIRFYWISNTKVRFTLYKFFGARLENPKINKRGWWWGEGGEAGVLITAGWLDFKKKNKRRGPFIWDLRGED